MPAPRIWRHASARTCQICEVEQCSSIAGNTRSNRHSTASRVDRRELASLSTDSASTRGWCVSPDWPDGLPPTTSTKCRSGPQHSALVGAPPQHYDDDE